MVKRQRIFEIFIVFTAITLSACASPVMQKVKPLAMDITSEKALVTFIRPSIFGGAIQFGVWDSDKFIGVLSASSYIQYLAEPGEHIFLGRAENWSYVKADLEGGKQYYILGKVFPGVWKARIAMDPINVGDKDEANIDMWLKKLTPTSVKPEKFDAYVTPRLEQVRDAAANIDNGTTKYEVLNKTDGR
jgi:hypothetical protein